MLRYVALTALCLGMWSNTSHAAELKGVILKMEADKVTFREGTDKDGKVYELAKDVKVYRFVTKDKKEPEPNGLKAEPLPNLPKAGCFAVINVVDGKITEISIPGKPKKN